MTFDELMDEVWSISNLPRVGRLQLPSSLSERTKNKLLMHSPPEVAKAIEDVVDKINHGSKEPLDVLINLSIN